MAIQKFIKYFPKEALPFNAGIEDGQDWYSIDSLIEQVIMRSLKTGTNMRHMFYRNSERNMATLYTH